MGVRREYKKVAELTASHWQRIEDQARLVLGDTTGLRRDIEERERVAIYWDNDALVGLVTLDLRHERFCGREVVGIYTGNTWLHPRWRGRNLIQRMGLLSYAESVIRWPRAHKYWFFGSNNFKSYLVLARNLRQFYPSRHGPTPQFETDYVRHLARAIYHTDVDPERLVYEPTSARSFSEQETRIPDRLRDDPDVQFFVDRNPNYPRGAKLMCLAPLTLTNWASIGHKALSRVVRSKHRS